MLERVSFVRKLFHDQPQQVHGTAEAVAPRVLRSTSRLPTLQDDAYHFKYYEGSPGLSWYTEWWYFNFFDKANQVGGICTFAVFNPGDRALGGAASLTAAVFTGAECNDEPAIEYFDLRELYASYEQPDVRLAANRLDVLDDGRCHVQAASRDGRIAIDLTYTRADEPQLLVDNVRNVEQPWSIANWLVSMPTATVNGTLTFRGKLYQLLNAAGYYDHVWGMWRVHAETWSWAEFSNPASQMAFVVAYPAAFQMSTAYLRYQDLRLAFVDQDFTITQHDPVRWHKLWQYPTRMTFSGLDSTKQYKLDLTWVVRQTAALWEYPLIVFEQTADFMGILSAKTPEGWTPVVPIQETGYCEATATWLPDFEAALVAPARTSPAKRRVVVLGGGIGGLSAAHELVERGFEVEVFERQTIPGGKSRSIPVPGSGIGGRADLLGEHGFRFFPGFYVHLPATMQRIPFGRKTCFDNLVPARRLLLAQFGEAGIEAPAGFPTSLTDLKLIFRNLTQSRIGLQPGEDDFFAERIWQVMTSCRARRLAELERISWWDFVGAEARSEAYQKFLAEGLSRSLVAAKAQEASARTIGQIQVRLVFGLLEPGQSTDRVLNGPTSQVFLNSWVAYLERQGVRYHTEWAHPGCRGREPAHTRRTAPRGRGLVRLGPARRGDGDAGHGRDAGGRLRAGGDPGPGPERALDERDPVLPPGERGLGPRARPLRRLPVGHHLHFAGPVLAGHPPREPR
jgi:NAD(P)-binding Rossmann-like domain